jgi:hypothetical protein
MNERLAHQAPTVRIRAGAVTAPGTGLRGRSRRQVVAVLLLIFGGYLLPVAGWLIGSVIWLLTPGWNARAKTAGLLVWSSSCLQRPSMPIPWPVPPFPARA